MKLIIDIPKATYDYWKEHKDEYVLSEAIANAIPYDDSGDCISREYIESIVRAEFVDLQDGTNEWRTRVNDACESILTEVHNAPTVEYTFEEAFQKTVCENKLYCPARPKGEWINREAVSNTIFPFWERYECNQCHKFSGYSNFCPNCGADMRGKEE